MKRKNYRHVLRNETIFANDDIRIIKTAQWTGCSVWKDEETQMLKVLLSQDGAFNSMKDKSTFAFCDGSMATDLEFDYLDGFQDGLALAALHGKGYGYVDKNINFVIAPKFNRAKEFKNGFAQVSVRENNKERWMIIDKIGKELISTIQNLTRIEEISEGMFRVSSLIFDGKGDSGFWNFFFLAFHHDYSSDAGLWGFIDSAGKEIVKPQYIFALDFEYGVALVRKGKWEHKEQWDERENTKGWWSETMLWGLIDKTGKEIVPCIYDEIEFFGIRANMLKLVLTIVNGELLIVKTI